MARRKKEVLQHEFIRNEFCFDIVILHKDSDLFGKPEIKRHDSVFDGKLTKEDILQAVAKLAIQGNSGNVVSIDITRKPKTVYTDCSLISGKFADFTILHYNDLNVKSPEDLKKAISEVSAFLDTIPEEQTRKLVW